MPWVLHTILSYYNLYLLPKASTHMVMLYMLYFVIHTLYNCQCRKWNILCLNLYIRHVWHFFHYSSCVLIAEAEEIRPTFTQQIKTIYVMTSKHNLKFIEHVAWHKQCLRGGIRGMISLRLSLTTISKVENSSLMLDNDELLAK